MNTPRRPSRRRAPLAAAALAVCGMSFGCASHGKLVALDSSVSEDEVLAAGDAKAAPELTRPLIHILEHRADYDTGIVVAALVALGHRHDAEAIPAIQALHSDPSEEVRWHCVLALKEIGGSAATAALANFASDPSSMIREEAATNS